MSKNIILAGKEYSKNSDLEKIAQTLELNPFVTTQFFEEANTKIISTNTTWNRSSPISAHSVVINAENYFGYTKDGYKRGTQPKVGAIICWRCFVF